MTSSNLATDWIIDMALFMNFRTAKLAFGWNLWQMNETDGSGQQLWKSQT